MKTIIRGLVLALGATSALAEEPLTKLTIRPARAPVPALKYRLTPSPREQISGNAAVFHHRALLMVNETRAAQAGGERKGDFDQRLQEWLNGPITSIPREEAAKALAPYGSALREVELGTRRRSCDWEFDQRDEAFELLLPEVQATRSLARLIVLKVRLATLAGETDEALHWLQVGLTLGRQVGQGPILIQDLVGFAITSQHLLTLEHLIQAPETPSLYWALANRPRPWIDLGPAFEGERQALEKTLPALRELDGPPWSVEKARIVADDFQMRIGRLTDVPWLRSNEEAAGKGVPSFNEIRPRLTLATMAAKVYPEARRALIGEGRSVAQVDAMPIFQAALWNAYRKHIRLNDDMYKWLGVPYAQSFNRLDEAFPRDMDTKTADPLFMVFLSLSPALNSVRVAEVRMERMLDAYQIVEALRLYAADHEGKLPPNLEALTDSPAPLDPATGKPFAYQVEGNVATLSAPTIPGGPEHPAFRVRCVIQMAK